MVRLRLSARRSALAAVAVFTTTTLAQGNNNNNDNEDQNTAEATATPTAEEEEAETTPTATPTQNTNRQTTSSSQRVNTVITGGDAATSVEEEQTTTSTTSAGAVAITGGGNNDPSPTESEWFPSLTNAPLDYTYPAAAVPPTLDAPFMDRSTLPQGTVFIIVGAILGALGLGILVWRGVIACLLARSVRRAAMEQHIANDKASFPAPPAQFYKYSDHNSSLSLAAGAAAGRGQRRTNRGPIPSQTPSQSNLFFSPTAAHGGGGNAPSRDSRFLPSGFYAAGQSSPNNPNHTHSISLTNLRPDSRGVARGMREVTPPDSPQFGARRDMSTSSLNLAAPGQGNRAPSAYLEDLLDENPQAFPPSQMPASTPHRSSGRF
ncbi:hypothetical protein B0T11DRAFT_79430 [Plectosphaerella cucumerina]|jgi:hypothetical protein|uniref:Uncharacterized protein n=1 Tax=Plectosphaerella cucumerina TaxID=40658 RepID=A0A8K0TEE7_9PEZI|nr:hypothetical protein B0T11DRAFT_79430 [Plectosphaerella cucumerina]